MRHGNGFSKTSAIFLVLLVHSSIALTMQTDSNVRLNDNSDWWSANNTLKSDASVKIQEREVLLSNFRVLDIDLAENVFSQAAAKLGNATIAERGDAATGRRQACYVSARDGSNVHLIFEQGEVSLTYYLFVDGANWDGSSYCYPTNLITPSLTTASGVHLGQTPPQVIAILGAPSNRSKNQLVYTLHVRKKASPEQLIRLREYHMQLSDKDFHNNYDFYDLGAAFVAKFVDSKLTYFSASYAETN
jgi:hypothetical protein